LSEAKGMGIKMKKFLTISMLIALIVSMIITGIGCKEEAVEEEAVEEEAVEEEVKKETEDEPEQETFEPATISITITDAVAREALQAVIDAAQEKLNLTIEFDIIAAAGAEDIMKTRLATGDMGDIFLNNGGAQMLVLDPEKNMVDLSGEEWTSKLDAGFKDIASHNGKLYGGPYGSAMVAGILYNKKVYDELGLEIPTTWDEFLANCDAAKAAGKIAMVGAYKDDWSAQIIFLGDYYNVYVEDPTFAENFTANKAKFATSPAALRSWEKLADSKDYMNEDFLATTVDIGIEMLATGEAAHWPMLTGLMMTIATNYPEAENDIGVFPILGDDAAKAGYTVWPSNTLHIYRESPNIEAAKRFLDFYLSDEGLAIYGSVVKAFGPYHIIGMDLGDNIYTLVNDIVPYFESGAVISALEFITPVKGPNCPQISVMAGSGMETPEEAAAEYDRDCKKQAIQLEIEGWQD